MKLVTAVINCHNQGKYLERAIDSVLNQTYTRWELKIMLDGCTDNSREIAESYKKTNLKIDVIELDDVGPSQSRHRAIYEALGDYYFVLDADDWIGIKFLEKTVEALDNCDKSFVYVNTVYYYESNNKFQRVPSPEYSFSNLLQNNFMSYCSLIKVSAYEDVGGYDLNNICYLEDYELYIKLGAKGHYGYHLPEDLFYYCVHGDSSFQTNRAKALLGVYKCYIISQMPDLYPLEWQTEAKLVLSKYPASFMSWMPKQQEELVK